MVALPWLESVANAESGKNVAKRMVHYYVPIGVVRRGFFPGEADHVIPKISELLSLARRTGSGFQRQATGAIDANA